MLRMRIQLASKTSTVLHAAQYQQNDRFFNLLRALAKFKVGIFNAVNCCNEGSVGRTNFLYQKIKPEPGGTIALKISQDCKK
jgi:hypothetical protein